MTRLEMNPYTNRGAILRPEEFFGRTREIKDIYTRLSGGQSVSLIGERRIGKSSLLNALQFQKEEYELPVDLRFVFLDMQSIAGCTEEFFIDYLANLAAEEADFSLIDSGRNALFEIAKQLGSRNQQLVVLLDEFDVLVHSEKISPDLFAFFRSWCSGHGVCMVAAFREGSIDRVIEDSRLGSPFLNIFGTVYIGPLEEAEARDLVTYPADHSGIQFSEVEIQKIFELCGYFPLFLQIACYHMFNLRQSGSVRSDWKEELEDRFTLEASPYFEYMWSRLSEDEKRMVYELSKAEKVVEPQGDSLKELIKKGIALPDTRQPKLFSSAFVSYVSHRSQSIDTQEGFTQAVKRTLLEVDDHGYQH